MREEKTLLVVMDKDDSDLVKNLLIDRRFKQEFWETKTNQVIWGKNVENPYTEAKEIQEHIEESLNDQLIFDTPRVDFLFLEIDHQYNEKYGNLEATEGRIHIDFSEEVLEELERAYRILVQISQTLRKLFEHAIGDADTKLIIDSSQLQGAIDLTKLAIDKTLLAGGIVIPHKKPTEAD